MKLENISLDETDCFDPILIDYVNNAPSLSPFYKFRPSVDGFKGAIEARKEFPSQSRIVLSEVLTEQYGPLNKTQKVEENISLLEHEKTFTITTGHQLNIFTGPLYFIYKIITVVNACKDLEAKYPDFNFVPVYWMASEDHDVEEISSFNLFGKKYSWETEQTGATGHLSPHSLISVLNQIPESVPLFERAYLDHTSLAEAVRFYINELFGRYGLIVLDGDHPRLKSLFSNVVIKELTEQKSNDLVRGVSSDLGRFGHKSQAYSREINLFYLHDRKRERIVKEDEQYKVLNTEWVFTESEIRAEVSSNPERFSPNVILRPVYQETILPNLAYSGGPAEIAYWLQLGKVFEEYNTFFPVLLPRNFALVINKPLQKKIEKLGLSPSILFKDTHNLKESYLRKHNETGFDLENETLLIADAFEKIKEKASEIDGSLAGFIGAESVKTFKSLENIGKRLKRAEEQKNETAMGQIDAIKEKLFPNGVLQERHDNFLNFYLNNQNFIHELMDSLKPFDLSFHVLIEE